MHKKMLAVCVLLFFATIDGYDQEEAKLVDSCLKDWNTEIFGKTMTEKEKAVVLLNFYTKCRPVIEGLQEDFIRTAQVDHKLYSQDDFWVKMTGSKKVLASMTAPYKIASAKSISHPLSIHFLYAYQENSDSDVVSDAGKKYLQDMKEIAKKYNEILLLRTAWFVNHSEDKYSTEDYRQDCLKLAHRRIDEETKRTEEFMEQEQHA